MRALCKECFTPAPHLDARVLLSRAYFLHTVCLPKMLTWPFLGVQCHEDVQACDVPDMQLIEGGWVVSIKVLLSPLSIASCITAHNQSFSDQFLQQMGCGSFVRSVSHTRDT